jgi:hypothetical protein
MEKRGAAVSFCVCSHAAADHNSDRYDENLTLGSCQLCGCEAFTSSATETRYQLSAAAPQLLATLKRARGFIGCGCREGHTEDCIFKQIDSVVAKAEGRAVQS